MKWISDDHNTLSDYVLFFRNATQFARLEYRIEWPVHQAASVIIVIIILERDGNGKKYPSTIQASCLMPQAKCCPSTRTLRASHFSDFDSCSATPERLDIRLAENSASRPASGCSFVRLSAGLFDLDAYFRQHVRCAAPKSRICHFVRSALHINISNFV